MAQKVNSVLFRRSLNFSEWDYKYVKLNKEEASYLLYKNIEIKKYLKNLFNSYGFLIINFRLEFLKSGLSIQISFIQDIICNKLKFVNKSKKKVFTRIIKKSLMTVLNNYYNKKIFIDLKLIDLNKSFEDSLIKSKNNRLEYLKTFKALKNLKNYSNFLNLSKLAFIIITNKKSAKLLAKILSSLISSQKRRHSNILTFINKIFDILIYSKLSLISGIKIQISGRINGFPRAKSRLLKIGSLPLHSITSIIDYSESRAYTSNGTFGIKVWVCVKK